MTDTLDAARPEVRSADRTSSAALAWLYGCTAFTGAGLLFMVQPMVAKLLLPSYGGSATVWSTSALFFQVLLLLGYLYTHLTTVRFGQRTQPAVHLVFLLLPLIALPLALPGSAVPDEGSSPALWLLRTLMLMVALPFLAISTTGPLLQRWYSWTAQRRSHDPYFLFAASNLGSFGGLLAYPLFIEPNLTLAQQRGMWSGGYLVFLVLMALCGVAAITRRRPDSVAPPLVESISLAVGRVPARTILYWTALAFLPSTLMLGVTAHISTDVAPIPLLWVIPLAIYLATFVAAFARTTRRPPVLAARGAIACAVVAAVMWPVAGGLPIALVVAVDLALLALVGFAAHGRLAADRPSPEKLTLFFLVLAVGGALGGLLNGLLAPMIFDRVWEYPMALAAVPLLLLGKVVRPDNWLTRRYHPAFVGFVVAACTIVGVIAGAAGFGGRSSLAAAALAGVILAGGWFLGRHPAALGVGLVLSFGVLTALSAGKTFDHTRTFFGAYSIQDRNGDRQMIHGNTVHGVQHLGERRTEPAHYYATEGPLGDVFRSDDFRHVAVMGLGTGGMAAWGSPGQAMKFYEIDPEIVEMAQDEELFTYLRDSRADIEVATGDGRLLLSNEPDASLDMVVLDAFNSDSVPVHLLTREAMRGYAEKLTSDGLMVVHISNRVFDLEPVLAAAADGLGWQAALGSNPRSRWVVLSPDPERIAAFEALPAWRTIDTKDQVAWTDDYSSVLDVLS